MTRITMIIDRSGSMSHIQHEAIEGFNDFLREQKDLGSDARVTVRLFNNGIRNIYSGNIMECPDLAITNYHPMGGTALLDAIGDTLDRLLKAWAQMQDKPRMVVAILTDGEEADSHVWNEPEVKGLIRECQRLGWEFIFLGAGIYWRYGAELGIEPKNVLDFTASKDGVKEAFAKISSITSRLRLGRDNG